MAEQILALKKRAVKAGMDKKAAMKANRSELEEFLSDSRKSTKKASKKSSTKASKKAKKSTSTKKATSTKKTSKKATSKKTAPKTKRKVQDDGGRNVIGSLDFSDTDGWNPREDSPVAAIFKALKKRKGDVDKTTDDLLPDAKEYVSLRKQDGTKRTKDEIRNLLRYRINRTKWEFARRTGQHNPSENRVEYGTGDYAKATKKAARKTSKPKANKTSKTKKNKKKSKK